MKKAINQRAFPEEMGIEGCLKLAKNVGFEGFEINIDEDGQITPNSDEKAIKKIREFADKLGIVLTSFATKELFFKYSLTDNDSNIREKAKKIVQRMLELASYAGVDTILVVPGSVSMPYFNLSPVPYDIAYQRSLDALRELVSVAERYKVNICIETILLNKFLLSPLEMRDFVDKIESKYVSIYFDVGNVQPFGYPEHWIQILGQRIKRVHFKDFRASAGSFQNYRSAYVSLLEGDVNWPKVIKALKQVGYEGYLIAEPLKPFVHHPDHLIYQTSMAMDRILSC